MCYTNAVLQQVLDNAYEGDPDEVMAHLQLCPACRKNFMMLKETDERIKNALQSGMAPPPVRAFNPAQSTMRVKGQEGRFFNMNKKTRKWSAVAAALIIGFSLLALQPVRVAAAEFLKIFRVQEVKAVSISESDLREIDSIFQQGTGSVDIENMLSFNVNSSGDESNLDNPDAAAIKEKYPNAALLALPEGFKYSNASVKPKTDVTMKLDVKKVNDFLTYIGEKNQLPQLIDQKPFVIHTDNLLTYQLNEIGGDSRNYVSVTQMNLPTVEVPDGVDAQSLADMVLSMNIMPQTLKQQLLGMGDLTTTLPFPYDAEREIKEDIMVKGQQAIMIHDKKSTNDYFRLCFKENNNLYLIEGCYPLDKLPQILNAWE